MNASGGCDGNCPDGCGIREITERIRKFIDVIKALDEAPESEGIERFRISSIEPNLCHDEVIHFVSESKRFMPHFHMPLQSGDDDMLARMRRRYRSDLYTERVALIKKLMPHACIGVDVIVGFPGESESRFLNSYNFLNQLDVSYLHVFTYSERENTVAWDMDGVVDKPLRKERTTQLRGLSEKKRRAFYARFEGKKASVLWEGAETNGYMFGFTPNYIKVARPFDPALTNTISTVMLGEVNPEGLMMARVPEKA
ncbi:MAG: hypothetical protein R3B47_10450 [Bacteroidia bacterium]